MYLEKQSSYARAVQRAKREYEQSLRTELVDNAGSGHEVHWVVQEE